MLDFSLSISFSFNYEIVIKSPKYITEEIKLDVLYNYRDSATDKNARVIYIRYEDFLRLDFVLGERVDRGRDFSIFLGINGLFDVALEAA